MVWRTSCSLVLMALLVFCRALVLSVRSGRRLSGWMDGVRGLRLRMSCMRAAGGAGVSEKAWGLQSAVGIAWCIMSTVHCRSWWIAGTVADAVLLKVMVSVSDRGLMIVTIS